MKVLDFVAAQWIWYKMVKVMPQTCAKILYKKALGRSLDLYNPKDLNEKINYLKFHADMHEWARLADKYAMREYVKERGLGGFLPKLYGMYESTENCLGVWDALPNQFVLKSNNGCGTVKLIKDKSKVSTVEIGNLLCQWFSNKRVGFGTVEPHYTLIKPCVIAEELLDSSSVQKISKSLIDYKIWCFNGVPYCILVVIDRNIEEHTYLSDLYSIDWRKRPEVMTKHSSNIILDKPKNLNTMLEIAATLSKGHPQMRVDLYIVEDKIYVGELTMTSACGYMDYFTPEFLLELGNQFSVERKLK